MKKNEKDTVYQYSQRTDMPHKTDGDETQVKKPRTQETKTAKTILKTDRAVTEIHKIHKTAHDTACRCRELFCFFRVLSLKYSKYT